ncbi:MAG: AAA family ATPase, partial [Calditrichaeota bacterium]|nr:AAA family ATPase [Calditrichota bacterium]
MKVSKLEIRNVLGIKAFAADDLGDVIKLKGKNGAGKSSVINAILAALKYDALPLEKRREILKQNGSVSLEITGAENDRWIVQRIIEEGKSRLKVKSKNGVTGNQSTLNNFIGDNFVDLGKFLEMPRDKQAKAVLDMVGLSEPLAEFDAQYQAAYQERRDIGRDRDNIGFNPEKPEAVEPVSVSELAQELQKAQDTNTVKNRHHEEMHKATQKIQELETQINELQKQKTTWESHLKIETELYNRIEPVEIEPIRQQIANAEEINQKAGIYARWQETRTAYNKKDAEYIRKTAELNHIKTQKMKLIKSAKFPVEGLSYSEEGLTYNNHPLISDGQYRKIAFSIAKALKGDLSLATFENFSLLDPEAQAEVIREAHEAGFQVFVEIVTGSNPEGDGFYIE